MSAGRGLLELAPGGRLVLNGVEWRVEAVEAGSGAVVLADGRGRVETRSIRWLIHHPDVRVLKDGVLPGRAQVGSGQPVALADLTDQQAEQARIRAEHVLEAMTGFRGGHWSRARPGEPRPAYDPEATTLTERRRAKAAELAAMPPGEASILGLSSMSERTLQRLSRASGESLLLACADGRWTRRRTGRRSVTEEVREAIFAVRKECEDRARISMSARHRLMHQYIAETFPDFPAEDVPSRMTLTRVWAEWFGSGGARARYERSAAQAEAAGVGRRLVVHRPGQVLALDSTPMPVKLRESVFGEAVGATLTLALDIYSHSIPAFRLTLASDTSVDIAMLLRDVMLPLPMRQDWGEEMEWPYPGVPAEIVTEFAGHKVAALPFFAPETVTTDHGSIYKSHAVVEAERVLGCNILPARAFRATDKFPVERAFSAIKTMLFEHLRGFTGTDVADRGADPEGDAVLTLKQMEHLIATWIVKVWQNHRLGEYAPAWGPGEEHSPNSLFAAAMDQGGWSMQIPGPELYYQVLRRHHVKVHARRGVKILGLWYHHNILDEDRFHRPSTRGGRHSGKWVVHSDRRDRRQVFFQDPDSPDLWHVLRWSGLAPEGEVPAFSDRSAEDLLETVRRRGLVPRSEAELLPVLLEILSEVAPIAQWPTRREAVSKKTAHREKIARSREISRAEAAEADRTAGLPPSEPVPWAERTRSVTLAVDADRRRRREERQEAGASRAVPRLLDDSLRRGHLFLAPPALDDEDGDGTMTLENA
ncbi:transposase [Kitasatospora sp. NPDC058406]|uniref:transposase n=1 Tax=Kitasatospora sp. NPDC058406 TaxID=3346483 RepID=UPI00366085E4